MNLNVLRENLRTMYPKKKYEKFKFEDCPFFKQIEFKIISFMLARNMYWEDMYKVFENLNKYDMLRKMYED